MKRNQYQRRLNQLLTSDTSTGPPPQPPQSRFGVTLRFRATSAVAGSEIQLVNLLGLLCLSKTTTTASTIFSHVKIRAIEAWAPPIIGDTTYTAPTPIILSTASETNASLNILDMRRVTDVSAGNHAAYCKLRMHEQDLQGKWRTALTQVSMLHGFLYISCPAGTIIDLHLSYGFITISDQGIFTQTPLIGTGLTAGTLYYNYLDAITTAGTAGAGVLEPVGVTNIAKLYVS